MNTENNSIHLIDLQNKKKVNSEIKSLPFHYIKEVNTSFIPIPNRKFDEIDMYQYKQSKYWGLEIHKPNNVYDSYNNYKYLKSNNNIFKFVHFNTTQLKNYLKDNKIKGYSNKNRNQLIKLCLSF